MYFDSHICLLPLHHDKCKNDCLRKIFGDALTVVVCDLKRNAFTQYLNHTVDNDLVSILKLKLKRRKPMTVYSYSFQKGITSLLLAFASTTAMMTGEVGYSSIFEECTPNSQILKRVFVILYIVVVTILVMNLMVSVDFCLHIMYC